MKTLGIHITGIVQGVGFRPFVYREAVARGLSGWVLNAGDGVHIEAQGATDALRSFVHALSSNAPAAARVEQVAVEELEGPSAELAAGAFRIIASDAATERTTLVSPDIATCPDCLRPTAGRATPSSDSSPMIARRRRWQISPCARNAPPNTPTPSIGASTRSPTPALPAGRTSPGARAARPRRLREPTWPPATALIADGGIIAIKGLGGFHLACNAADESAVTELRRRKRRSNKPLAVMVRDLASAEALCHVDDAERELLGGTIRPIVLLQRRAEGTPDNASNSTAALAPQVAGDLPELGVMLPYTPLQHLLLAACANRSVNTLVMTSGNVSEEPIETDDALAWHHLVEGGLADALLGNDRAILARFDDSVVRVVDGVQCIVRRARGYAPRPVALPALTGDALDAPRILACGPEQKATLALTREHADGSAECLISQHIGDLENAETFDAWQSCRLHMQDLFDLTPAALACDRHPGYLSSQWARTEATERSLPLVEVQHHHAHIASVIAEAAARGDIEPNTRVVGIALDGTGAGDDGTVWGGEILVADLTEFTRAAHLRTWHLPGGAAAVRDARRNAYGLLHAYGLLDHPGAQPLLATMTERERTLTQTMIERGLNSPLTSSMGRFLDAVAALLGICTRATYEGEPAIELEAAAARVAAGHSSDVPSPTTLDSDAFFTKRAGQAEPSVIDFTDLLSAVLDATARGENPASPAWDVHKIVARTISAHAMAAARENELTHIALSGGCFMNRLLLTLIKHNLEANGFTVLTPRAVPVNDGCIAYGQAAVARARLVQQSLTTR